jgi:hypothetical protein
MVAWYICFILDMDDGSSPPKVIDDDDVRRCMFHDCWSFLVAFALWCGVMLVSLGVGVLHGPHVLDV